MNGIEQRQETEPHKYSKIFFDKCATIQWINSSFFLKIVLEQLGSHMKKKKKEPRLTLRTLHKN